ncbi:MAG TPA: DUF2079 domain-containing protein [Ktedonobacteraceae bacterium]|nr:DUF2079 domain-containing protein [Ktedonobacteraceae bacterium]
MKLLKQLDLHTQKRIAWSLLALAMLVYAVVMSIEAVLRYETFKATAFDLGNMDQVIWNTIHGRPFQFTNQAIDWYGPPNRLGVHVEPIMLLISLLYAFYADPRTLLVFQTLVLVAGAPAVFLLTRRYLPSWPLLASVMSAAYLLSPALLGINIFDFHPDSLATPLFLYAILAITYRRFIWFLVLCFFACICKEDMSLAIALFGVLLIWKYRMPRLGLLLIVGGVIWAYIAFKMVIPHFYTGVQANNFWYRYRYLGSSPASAVANLLLHPWLIFTTLITLDRVYYILGLLRSTGFVCLLAPEWLLPILPKLASNVLSDNTLNYSGVYHYNAAIIPFVMLAAIHGTRRAILLWQGWSKEGVCQDELELLIGKPAPDTEQRPYPVAWMPARGRALVIRAWQPVRRLFIRITPWFTRLTLPDWRRERWQSFSARMYPLTKKVSPLRLQWVFCVWIIFMLGLNYCIALSTLNSFWPDHLPGTREQQIQQLIDMIPPTASVSASDDLNPHVSERQRLAVFPSIWLDAARNQPVQYILVDLNSPTLGDRAAANKELNSLAKDYRPLKIAYGVVLLQRRGT